MTILGAFICMPDFQSIRINTDFPLLTNFAISGQLAKEWVFKYYRSKNKVVIQPYIIPPDPRTAAQLSCRSKLAAANNAWHSLRPEIQDWYRHRALKRPLTGYNLFIKEYMLDNLTYSRYF